jgi:hypothetical protein
MVECLNRIDARNASDSALGTWAFDDIAREIARAGYGLGGVTPLLPFLSEDPTPTFDRVTLRSNPEGFFGVPLAELASSDVAVPVVGAELFETGDWVLLSDLSGNSESAEVVRVEQDRLAFRSLDTADGRLRSIYSPYRRARVSKLREVRFLLQESATGEGNLLVKEVSGHKPRVLTRGIERLQFDYLDDQGQEMAAARLELGHSVAAVRLHLRFPSTDRGSSIPSLTTAVALGRHSVVLDLETERQPRLRLTHVLDPIANPIGLAGRAQSGERVVVSSDQDATSLYTYPLERRASREERGSIILLPEVRGPIALSFGPERGPLAGSLFVAAFGFPPGLLIRVLPDDRDRLSPGSRTLALTGTEILDPIGGMAFGLDGALYISRREYGALFRYRFDSSGEPEASPEEVARVPGSPGPLTLGRDGSMYFLMEEDGNSSLWRLPFDETLSPGPPSRVGPLPGRGLSLAWDPRGSFIYALVRDDLGDSVIVEVSPSWSGDPSEMPFEIFRLSDWRRQLEDAASSRPISLMAGRVPEGLDFLSFGPLGSLYLGDTEMDLVLRVHLKRPGADEHLTMEVGPVVDSQFAEHR